MTDGKMMRVTQATAARSLKIRRSESTAQNGSEVTDAHFQTQKANWFQWRVVAVALGLRQLLLEHKREADRDALLLQKMGQVLSRHFRQVVF